LPLIVDNHVVVVAAVLLAVAITGLYAVHEHVITIHGTVNVPENHTTGINLELNITKPIGDMYYYNLTVISVEKGFCLRLRADNVKASKGFKLVLSGEAILENVETNKTYTISMPCLASIGAPCYRIQTLIPGFDTPLPLEPGNYTLTLHLHWKASGKGHFTTRLVAELGPCRIIETQG